MNKFLKSKTIIFILLLGAVFRFYGLNWDQNQHLHPDERFLTMVTTAIQLPKNLAEYLNPLISPMNPYNVNFGFFVYGTFPLNLTKIIGELTGFKDYGNVHLVGRIISAIFDIGTILLIYKIGKKIFNRRNGLWAAFLYSAMVLPIQLSHFYAVDTFLNFFIVLSFFLLLIFLSTKHRLLTVVALGASFGFALACKISAFYFVPIIALGFIAKLIKERKIKIFIIDALLLLITSGLMFRLNQPQVFAGANFLQWQINPQFISNLKELKGLSGSDVWYPPAVFWHSTTPLLSPLITLIFWGLGLPLGIVALFSFLRSVVKIFSRPILIGKNMIILWILLLFIYQGIQFGKVMRYFLPIYPFLAILSADFLISSLNFWKKRFSFNLRLLYLSFGAAILIYPLSFMSIYTKPITRVSASEWIYNNIPAGSVLLNEEWDDGLPLYLPNHSPGDYIGKAIYLYDFDTEEKWQRLNLILERADYIILSSNRAYGSTMKLPQKYPVTIRYYQNLFNGGGGFEKVTEFTSYPCFPPGKFNLFCFNDDSAEESFTVYDHPKVMIFKRK